MSKKVRKKVPFKYVQVIWRDAEGTTAWTKPEDIEDAPRIVSRGWLVKETKTTLMLAADVGLDDHSEVNSIMKIPKGMLVEVIDLGC